MSEHKIIDLVGREVEIGNTVAIGNCWNVGCNYLMLGEVVDIHQYPTYAKALIRITNNGAWRHDKSTNTSPTIIGYSTSNRVHNNILVVK